MIKRGTTRDRGLNARSLTYLFKVVVLTKLLYGGIIWLNKNLSVFDSFWNDVILKCSGSMYYPHRELTEIALQIPPLDVQLEMITVKFLCKCLTSTDFMNSILHQIDGSLEDKLHHQLKSLKNFLAWKTAARSRRGMDLLDPCLTDAAQYNKSEIEQYTRNLWTKRASNRCMVKNRNSPQDALILQACELGNKDLNISKRSYLFGHNSSRYMDTRVMEFLHGSSDRFQNFYQSRNRQVNSSIPNTCKYCDT